MLSIAQSDHSKTILYIHYTIIYISPQNACKFCFDPLSKFLDVLVLWFCSSLGNLAGGHMSSPPLFLLWVGTRGYTLGTTGFKLDFPCLNSRLYFTLISIVSANCNDYFDNIWSNSKLLLLSYAIS